MSLIAAAVGWVELLRNPSLQARRDGFRKQIGRVSDLSALPILRLIGFMESVVCNDMILVPLFDLKFLIDVAAAV